VRKKHTYTSVFDVNRFVLFCVFFTVSIAINIVIASLLGDALNFGVLEFIALSITCAAPVVTFILFDYIPGLKYFRDDRCSPWLSFAAHYLISLTLIILPVFVLGFFEPFYSHPNWVVSGKIAASYTPSYAMFALGMIIIDVRKTAIANNNLRKIKINKRNLAK